MIEFIIAGRRIKLWHVLVPFAVLGTGLSLLPERVGLPILFLIEGALIVFLLVLLIFVILKKLTKK